MSNRIYGRVNGNRPKLNRFDLSYTNTFSANFGRLYVAQCDEAVPGDVWKISDYVHCELQPMVAPVMSDIQLYVHSFFVPYRLLYGIDPLTGQNLWEMFVTGGQDGSYDAPLQSWEPDWADSGVSGFSSNKIWDYVGLPTHYDSVSGKWFPDVPKGLGVSIAPKRAYNFIYNSFYRDEFLIDEVSLDNEDLLQVSFKKDYFTSAALSQQVGDVPAFPISYTYDEPTITPVGSPALDGYFEDADSHVKFYPKDLGLAPIVGLGYSRTQAPFTSYVNYVTKMGDVIPPSVNGIGGDIQEISNVAVHSFDYSAGTVAGDVYLRPFNTTQPPSDPMVTVYPRDTESKTSYPLFSQSQNYNLTPINLKIDNGFNVNDMRLIFAIQRLQELNSRAGVRYTEWLQAHYNVFPRDDRLQRPEYIGGAVFNVTVGTNIQSSSTDAASAQGNKVGIGQIDSVQKIGKYRVKEQGLIMTLCSFRPKPIYQQGVNRQWLRQVKEDYYIPELAFLSEQGVYNAELFVDGTDDDKDIFGYQAHWNELRSKNNINSGAVRSQLNYWTLTRKFSSRPHLNQDFIEVVPSDFQQIFAVANEDPFVVSFSNLLDVYRPIPADGVPGLIDHVYGGF